MLLESMKYIETHPNRLPLEFTLLGYTPEPWESLDTLIWGKFMSLRLGGNFPVELWWSNIIMELGVDAAQQLMPPYNDGPALFIPTEVNNYAWLQEGEKEEDAFLAHWWRDSYRDKGSNNWVVSGDRTNTGMPFLANDTPVAMSMPSMWYGNGLHGGQFQSVGATFPGVPLVFIGNNVDIAWGVTDMPADVQDLYVERLSDTESPTQYEFMGEWRDLEIRSETIEVNNAEPVTLNVYTTHHGPIINDVLNRFEATEPLSLQWTVLQGTNLFRGVVQVNLASNWTEFHQALQYWEAPIQHFVYADPEGNIGYQGAGAIPLRADRHQGVVPLPGWTGTYEWEGILAMEDHFSVLNPDTGFIATANDEIAPDDYLYHLTYEWADPYRTQRLYDVLSNDSAITMSDMQALQSDTYSIPAEKLRPYLLMIEPDDDLQRAALDQLEAWYLNADVSQVGTSIFQVWYWFMVRNLLDEIDERPMVAYGNAPWFHMPMVVDLMEQPDDPWFDNLTTDEQETRDDIVKQSFADAIPWFSLNHGTDPNEWQWGDIHTITFSHNPFGQSGIAPLEWLFNRGTSATPGDDYTVNMGWIAVDAIFTMIGGTAQRMIVDLSALISSKQLILLVKVGMCGILIEMM